MHLPTRRPKSWASDHRSKKLLNRALELLKTRGLLKNIVLGVVALGLLGVISLALMFFVVSRDLPDPNSLSIRDVPQSTKIYDRTGTHLLYEISGDEKRTLVKLAELPAYVAQAAITAEDRKFYEHNGIDLKGILRSAIRNVINLDATGAGGSTITQQMVKHAVLTSEKRYTRKIKEILISLAVERQYTKDEIMQMYLNEIPFGSTNYGIESAAQSYFQKPAKDLTLPEAATIIAITNRPTTLLNNPDLLKDRRDWILSGMADLGYVTREESDAAIAAETPVQPKVGSNITAPHFVMWVKQQLIDEIGLTDREVEQGGLKVITSLDYDKQIIAEEAVKANLEARQETGGFNNTGLVALNPKTGEVLAMVGSVDFNNEEIDGQVNVTLRPLQPGSSFKPIIYAAAFEKGYTPNTVIWDTTTEFPTATGPYKPKNYTGLEYGLVSMRKALQGSLNIPAVKTLYLVGLDAGLDFAERLHYTTLTDRSRFGLSVVLGGAEVTPLEHTSAYAVFANNGVYHKSVSILKVEDPAGKVLTEWKVGDGEKAVDANISAMISNVLSDDASRAYIFGAGGRLTLPGRPVAVKTGTTNNNKDAWAVGYTPSLAAGVWVGNTNGTTMTGHADGSVVAAPVWNEFMRRSLEGTVAEGFPAPVIDTTGKPVLDGQQTQTTFTIDKASGKLATDRTPAHYREEKTCGEFHDILHYVNTSDPRGAVPTDPSVDFMYAPWETGVASFIERYNAGLPPEQPKLENCTPPTESDDVHTEENTPEIKILKPDARDDLGRSFDVEVDAEARRGVDHLEYAIDGTTIRTSRNSEGTTITLPSWVSVGRHTLTVSAVDDVDNRASDDVEVNVTENSSSSISVRITNPFNNQTIEKTGAGYVIAIEIPDAELVTKLTIRSQNVDEVGTDTIYSGSASSLTTATWNIGSAGEYLLTAEATLTDGTTVDAEPVRVYVTESTSVLEVLGL